MVASRESRVIEREARVADAERSVAEAERSLSAQSGSMAGMRAGEEHVLHENALVVEDLQATIGERDRELGQVGTNPALVLADHLLICLLEKWAACNTLTDRLLFCLLRACAGFL